MIVVTIFTIIAIFITLTTLTIDIILTIPLPSLPLFYHPNGGGSEGFKSAIEFRTPLLRGTTHPLVTHPL